MQDRPTLFLEVIQRRNHNVRGKIKKLIELLKIILILGFWSWQFQSTIRSNRIGTRQTWQFVNNHLVNIKQ